MVAICTVSVHTHLADMFKNFVYNFSYTFSYIPNVMAIAKWIHSFLLKLVYVTYHGRLDILAIL